MNGLTERPQYEGMWLHFDARPPERAVVHLPMFRCPFGGRHPAGDCPLLPEDPVEHLDP